MADKQNFNIGNVRQEGRSGYVIESFDKLTNGKADKYVVQSYDNGGYELVAYLLNPKNSRNKNNQITAFLVSGIHGDEGSAIGGIYHTVSALVDRQYSKELTDGFGQIIVVPIVSRSALDSGTRRNGYVDINRTFWIDSKNKPEEVKQLERLVNEFYHPDSPSLFVDFHNDTRYDGSYILANTNPKSYDLADKAIAVLRGIGLPILEEDIREKTENGTEVVLKNNRGVLHKDAQEAYKGAFGPPPFARNNDTRYQPVSITLEINARDPQLARDGYLVASNTIFRYYGEIILANSR